jgi:hypothetical protein
MSKLLDALKRAEHLRKERQAEERASTAAPSGAIVADAPALQALRRKLDELEALHRANTSGNDTQTNSGVSELDDAIHQLELRLAEVASQEELSARLQRDAQEAKRSESEAKRRDLLAQVTRAEEELAQARASARAQQRALDETAVAEESSLQARLHALEDELHAAKEAASDAKRHDEALRTSQSLNLESRRAALEASLHVTQQECLQIEARIAQRQSEHQERLASLERELLEAEQGAEAALQDKQSALAELETAVAARIAAAESANARLRSQIEVETQNAHEARARQAAEARLRVAEDQRARSNDADRNDALRTKATDGTAVATPKPESRTGTYNPLLDAAQSTTALAPTLLQRALPVLLVCASMLTIGFWVAESVLRKPASSVVTSGDASSAKTRVRDINEAPSQKFEPVTLKLDRELRRRPR